MFNLSEKIRYYKSRFNLSDDNKRSYARGFVNGASVNHSRRHNIETKKELSYLYDELKATKNEADRHAIIESIPIVRVVCRGIKKKRKIESAFSKDNPPAAGLSF